MSNVTIQKRGKYYQYKFEIARVDGKRKFLSKSGFKTKSEADIKAVSKGLGHRNYDLRGNYATTILRNGVEIEDYITKPAKVKILKIDEEKNISRLAITIHEGKNRQVRKMCEAIGKKVQALHRSKIGNIDVKDLKIGTWRYLKPKEIEQLIK